MSLPKIFKNVNVAVVDPFSTTVGSELSDVARYTVKLLVGVAPTTGLSVSENFFLKKCECSRRGSSLDDCRKRTE
jgi:hypothetical protein